MVNRLVVEGEWQTKLQEIIRARSGSLKLFLTPMFQSTNSRQIHSTFNNKAITCTFINFKHYYKHLYTNMYFSNDRKLFLHNNKKWCLKYSIFYFNDFIITPQILQIFELERPSHPCINPLATLDIQIDIWEFFAELQNTWNSSNVSWILAYILTEHKCIHCTWKLKMCKSVK